MLYHFDILLTIIILIVLSYTGKGNLDRSVTASGPLDVVNRAVESMKYICRSMDGCLSGYVDRVTVIVNDEGFNGKGGPLTDTQTMMIVVV